MMVGMIIASTVNGRVLAPLNRYKLVQVGGLAMAVAAFGALAWAMHSGSGYLLLEPPIFVLGAGLGLVMPNMTIVVQHALPLARRGVGTAMLTFFRSLGGLLGVTGSGAILAHQLHANGVAAAASAGAGAVLDPLLRDVYRHAIANVFTAGTAIVLVALLLMWFLPDVQMPSTSSTTPPKD
jgi:MFS family permease